MANPNDASKQNKDPFSFLSKVRAFFGGANTKTTPDMLGLDIGDKGQYIDSRNARFDDEEKNGFGLSKIKGERIAFDMSATLSSNYVCICFAEVNNLLFTIFASPDPTEPPSIFLNSLLVCQSFDLGFQYTHHIQYDYNDNEVGEIYLTDYLTVPIYFNIKDLQDNSTTQKYFSDFVRAEYEINFKTANNLVVFDYLVNTGDGLPVGKYGYAYRYVSSESTSAFSIFTPNITVPINYDFGETVLDTYKAKQPYPKIKTYGSDASTSGTGYSPQIRFRIDNRYNYDFVEIVRVSYNTGAGLDYVVNGTIIKRIATTDGQIGVITFIDSIGNENEKIELSTGELSQIIPSIKRAKAIRYFYNKVILGNIEYEDRTIKDGENFEFIKDGSGKTWAYPILKNLGVDGLKDSYENTYHTPYMNGEIYGFDIVFRDSTNTRTFAAPISDLESFQFPNRRDEATAESIAFSDPGAPPTIASVDGNVVPTYDCVDNTYLKQKEESYIPTAAMQTQLGGDGFFKNQNMAINISNNPTKEQQIHPITTITPGYSYLQDPSKYGYLPFRSTKLSDTKDNYIIPPQVAIAESDTETTIGALHYHVPYLFQPRYNTLGLQIKGLSSWPDWATSFQIVRSRRAGRVVCQGLGFWKITERSYQPISGDEYTINVWNLAEEYDVRTAPYFYNFKQKDSFSLHIPDADFGGIDPTVILDIQQHPENYEVQLVAPLGIGSEMYNYYMKNVSGGTDPATGYSYPDGINPVRGDIATYARVHRENHSPFVRRANPLGVGEDHGIPAPGIGGTAGYVAYGKWINLPSSVPPVFAGNANGNHVFSINSFLPITSENGAANIFTLKLNEDVYNSEKFDVGIVGPSGTYQSDYTFLSYDGSDNNKNFMEPVYMVNIIKKVSSIQQTDYTNFIQTGCNVALESVVAVSDGVTDRIEVCGERLQDCCSFFSQGDDNYIYVDIANDGNYVKYIDITYKTLTQKNIINNDINNGTTFYNGQRLYGTYSLDLVNQIKLGMQTVPRYIILTAGSIPVKGCQIKVKYDNRYPLDVFGGDTYVGEATAPVINRGSNAGGEYDKRPDTLIQGPYYDGDILNCTIGFPSNIYMLNPAIGVVDESSTSHCYIQPAFGGFGVLSVRQLISMYTCQCYCAIHLNYSDCFPNVHYINRPGKWDVGKKPSEQMIYGDYETDYPNEEAKWNLGGFRINNAEINSDLAKAPVQDIYVSGSQFFDTNNLFKNRVAWSITRPIQDYQSPSLRLFIATNIYDTQDSYGEIKKLYVDTTPAYGENLYAWTDENVVMLLTQKTILTGANGAQVASQDTGSLDATFIAKQIWLGNKKDGALQDELWMAASESGDAMFFYNRNSVFMFKNNQLINLLKDFDYYNSVNERLLKRIINWTYATVSSNARRDLFTGVYNKAKKEYLFGANLDIFIRVLTFFGTGHPRRQEDISFQRATTAINRNIYALNSSVYNDYWVTFINTYNTEICFIKSVGTKSFTVYSDNTYTTPLLVVQPGDIIAVIWNFANNNFTVEKVDNSFEYRNNYLFSFSDKDQKKGFNGLFDYQFEKYYSSQKQSLFGVKERKIFLLDSGETINGAPIVFEAFQASTPIAKKSVEFAKVSIDSSEKPTSVDFYYGSNLISRASTLDGALLKNYHSFENYIPKDGQGNRLQGIYIIYNVKHDTYGEFQLKLVDTKYKVIK